MAKDRKPAAVERDKILISRLYLEGKTQGEIAGIVKVSQPTVSRAIKELIAEWQTERVYDINEAKARELAKVDHLELTYWDAWDRSRQPAITEDEGFSPKGPTGNTRTEYPVGNEKYLAGVQWCIERRCLILGVDAPKKIAPTNPEGTEPIELIVKYATDDKSTKPAR